MSWTPQTLSSHIINGIGINLLDLLRSLFLRPRIVVCDFDPDLSRILSSVAEIVPQIVLAAPRNNDILEIDPGLTNDLGLLVIVKEGHLQLEVVWRVVYCKPKLLVPKGAVSNCID